MNLLFAPDSFKGSLSSTQILAILTREAEKAFPSCRCVGIPMADGGEGTMEALVSALHGAYVTARVSDPLGRPVEARYARLDADTALIEMAAASGLPLVPEAERDPAATGTRGTGELIRAALDAGCRHIILGVGGSATNDGGMGALFALGLRFLDAGGDVLAPVGANLGAVAAVDTDGLDPAAREARFTLMCDVDNPLVGPDGAAMTYGAQKGGTPQQLAALEAGMQSYAALLERLTKRPVSTMRGGGAAGGLSAGLAAFLDVTLQSGIDTVLSLCRFEEKLSGVDLVVTGEGRVDWQSAHGKVLYGIGTLCQRHGVPVAAIVGGMGEGAEAVYDCGIRTIMTTINAAMDTGTAMLHAEELYGSAAARLFSAIRIGMELRR